MTATHGFDSTAFAGPVLSMALELGEKRWKLAFSPARGQKPRLVTIVARDCAQLLREIADAKARFSLPSDTPVFCCYEAGRDGFWLHRFLLHHNVNNIVVDSSSIEVNRRARRAKSDQLDAGKLLSQLIRYREGERKVWSVVHVPSPADEDRRHLHRELDQARRERTAHANRIQGLLVTLGLRARVDSRLPKRLEALRQWNGEPIPDGIRQRLLRDFERVRFLAAQIRGLEAQQIAQIRDDATPHVDKVRKLLQLRGIGRTGATVLVYECFGWRTFANRRELTGLAGLVPTPYQSGETNHDQGISKAGNMYIRWIMVQLAWSWLRYQPRSALTRWYVGRFAGGNSRVRRVGIVALARKLFIALWKYVERGEVPVRGKEVNWTDKIKGRPSPKRHPVSDAARCPG